MFALSHLSRARIPHHTRRTTTHSLTSLSLFACTPIPLPPQCPFNLYAEQVSGSGKAPSSLPPPMPTMPPIACTCAPGRRAEVVGVVPRRTPLQCRGSPTRQRICVGRLRQLCRRRCLLFLRTTLLRLTSPSLSPSHRPSPSPLTPHLSLRTPHINHTVPSSLPSRPPHVYVPAFTAPRHSNKRSWLYRLRPSVLHRPFEKMDNGLIVADFTNGRITPNQLRWMPVDVPEARCDFVEGLRTVGGAGEPTLKMVRREEERGERRGTSRCVVWWCGGVWYCMANTGVTTLLLPLLPLLH